MELWTAQIGAFVAVHHLTIQGAIRLARRWGGWWVPGVLALAAVTAFDLAGLPSAVGLLSLAACLAAVASAWWSDTASSAEATVGTGWLMQALVALGAAVHLHAHPEALLTPLEPVDPSATIWAGFSLLHLAICRNSQRVAPWVFALYLGTTALCCVGACVWAQPGTSQLAVVPAFVLPWVVGELAQRRDGRFGLHGFHACAVTPLVVLLLSRVGPALLP